MPEEFPIDIKYVCTRFHLHFASSLRYNNIICAQGILSEPPFPGHTALPALRKKGKKELYLKKKLIIRWVYYLFGMLVLALGLTLNTKSDLGSSPIISISYTLSFLCDISFADLTLLLYVLFVFLEFILKGRNRRWTDILQIPLSIVFTRFVGLFSNLFDFSGCSIAVRFMVLLAGILCTGIGAALTVDMDLVANPGDAFVQAVSMCIHREMGLSKNIVDISCVIFSAFLGYAASGKIVGIGIGTLIAMILVGRVISLFNHLFKKTLLKQAF